jgi:hypothetical protein
MQRRSATAGDCKKATGESSVFINAEAGLEGRLIHRKAPVVEEIEPSKAA